MDDPQIRNIPLILRVDLLAMPVRQEIRRVKVPHKRRAIHHAHAAVQPGDFGKSARGDQLCHPSLVPRSLVRIRR